MKMKVCYKCELKCQDAENFCSSCGERLEVMTPPDPELEKIQSAAGVGEHGRKSELEEMMDKTGDVIEKGVDKAAEIGKDVIREGKELVKKTKRFLEEDRVVERSVKKAKVIGKEVTSEGKKAAKEIVKKTEEILDE